MSEQASSSPNWSQHCWKTKHFGSGVDLARTPAGFAEVHWPLPSQFSGTETHTSVHTAMHTPTDTRAKLCSHTVCIPPTSQLHYFRMIRILTASSRPCLSNSFNWTQMSHWCDCSWCWLNNHEQLWWYGQGNRRLSGTKNPAWSIIWSERNKPKRC